MPELTIFTTPKPFTNPHIAVIQRNALQSWKQLGPEVQVVVVGDEEGLAKAAAELGLLHLPGVARNSQGTPLVSSIFSMALEAGTAPVLAYVNADILLLPDFLSAAQQAARQPVPFLLVGQRWDLDVTQPIDFSPGWVDRLRSRLDQEGRLHPPSGSDYFIFPRGSFANMPAFAIGRAGWDNWMIYEARRQGWLLANATRAIRIVHQNHDYSHLPGGQPHYRLPETFENVRLAGGKRTIFRLEDANRRFEDGQFKPVPLSWRKFWREVEIFPLVRMHSRLLANLLFAVFHPIKAYWEFRVWLSPIIKRLRGKKPAQ